MPEDVDEAMSDHEHKDIGEVCGMVRSPDGTMQYKLFNGMHHGAPTFTYAPVRGRVTRMDDNRD